MIDDSIIDRSAAVKVVTPAEAVALSSSSTQSGIPLGPPPVPLCKSDVKSTQTVTCAGALLAARTTRRAIEAARSRFMAGRIQAGGGTGRGIDAVPYIVIGSLQRKQISYDGADCRPQCMEASRGRFPSIRTSSLPFFVDRAIRILAVTFSGYFFLFVSPATFGRGNSGGNGEEMLMNATCR